MKKKQKLQKAAGKLAEQARRARELKQYGRLLSLRPSVAHKSRAKYDRHDKSWKKDQEG